LELLMSPRIPDFSKLTVLVIEDQDYIRKLIAQLLQRLGCEKVLEADDGAVGLDILAQETPDLVLCDVRMKQVDGLEFLRQLRSGKGVRDPHLPVIFLTSDSDRTTVLEAMKSEVDGYLVKPVSPADLKAKIIAVLSKRMAGRRPHQSG
jgi:two-component system chemotaxis response regulator CheY